MMTIGVLADGFLVGNLGRLGFDLQIVTLLHLFQGDAQMQVAQTTQHGLLGMGVVFQRQAGVFLQQLVDGIGQLLLVTPSSGADGQPK